MSDPFAIPHPKSKQIGTKPVQSPILTHYIQEEFSEYQLFRKYKFSTECPKPYAEYKEFCRINEYLLRKAEKVGNNIYVQLGTQSNVHAQASCFVTDITTIHNLTHPLNRIHGASGGCIYANDNEYEPDFQLAPIGFPLCLGPTVVGEIQYSTPIISPPLEIDPARIGVDQKAELYLRHTLHISAFICVDVQFPWPADGYPRIVLYYYERPLIHHDSQLIQPKRIVNIGRTLTPHDLATMVAKYPNLDDTNMFGNGFGGCGDCHPAADPMHYVFEIPGPAVLFVDPEHTLAAGNMPIQEVAVGIEVDCRVLLHKIVVGALQDNLPVGPQWPWDPMAII